MDLAMGAMVRLPGKLSELLKEDYKLEKGARDQVESISTELGSLRASLEKVAEVPPEQLDPQVRVWAHDIREVSYDLEDSLDTILVRFNGDHQATDPDGIKRRLIKKMDNLFSLCKGNPSHEICSMIKGFRKQLQEITERRDRYKIDGFVLQHEATTSIDPRLVAYTEESQLVGIAEQMDTLINMLHMGRTWDCRTRIVSVVGVAGLGKTTLASAVHSKIKMMFDAEAFVSVGRDPDVTKIFRDVLIQLDKGRYMSSSIMLMNKEQLTDEIGELVEHKRSLIIIDDTWDWAIWEPIIYSFGHSGSRIIMTTRIYAVARGGGVYTMKPLSEEDSKNLLYIRLFGTKGKEGPLKHQADEVIKIILKKCRGIPLFIITIASMLVNTPLEDWSKVYNSTGFGHEGQSETVHNTRKITTFSYYDLPIHLKTCLLYLSTFPQDHWIEKESLIWKWTAEGFVKEHRGIGVFERGNVYFNELINRSLIEPTECDEFGTVDGCRIHDIVLDFINVMATEESFVEISDRVSEEHNRRAARRLAVHRRRNGDKNSNDLLVADLAKLRSFNAIACRISTMPRVMSFQVLRVLELEDCDVVNWAGCELKHLGKLLQLRYIGLRGTAVAELPSEIGDLPYLQSLDVRNTGLEALPATVGKLRTLMRLCVNGRTKVLARIGNLTSLQQLRLDLRHGNMNPNIAEDLGKLTELRMLQLVFSNMDEGSLKALVKSLVCLINIQDMEIRCVSWEWAVMCSRDDYQPLWALKRVFVGGLYLPRLPKWVPFSMGLRELHLGVLFMDAQDMEHLSEMRWLRFLYLRLKGSFSWTVPGGARLFRDLMQCHMINIALTFQQGAMPLLRKATFSVPASSGGNGVGLENLPSLNHAEVRLEIRGDTEREVEEAEAALRRAAAAHPNRPTIDVVRSVWSEVREDAVVEGEISATGNDHELCSEVKEDAVVEEEISATEDNNDHELCSKVKEDAVAVEEISAMDDEIQPYNSTANEEAAAYYS